MPDFIPELSINLDSIFTILKDACFNVEIQRPDGEIPVIIVHHKFFVVFIYDHSNAQLIQIKAYSRIDGSLGAEESASWWHSINQSFSCFCGFAVQKDKPDVLISNYYLSYNLGLIPFHVVSAINLMANTTIEMIEQYEGYRKYCNNNI